MYVLEGAEPAVGMREYCRWYFKLDEGAEPTKMQMSSINRMCCAGSIKGAFRVGHKWYIPKEATHPESA